MKNNIYDVAIIGSGPAGVHAAYPLVKAGLKVAMIDGGQNSKNALIKANQLLKIKSNIEITQSLAKGGLSEIWHYISDFFTPEELTKVGLPVDEILGEYKEIAKLVHLNLKAPLDIYGKAILRSSKNVYRLPLALYHTSLVVDQLIKSKNFKYIPSQLVMRVTDKRTHVEIQSQTIENQTKSNFKALFLILAAGSPSSTRILLRSFDLFNKKVPFLTKGNYMIVCLQPQTFFKKNQPEKTSGQVAIAGNDYFIQFYKSKPHSIYKALPFIPLPKTLATLLFPVLTRFLMIADVRFSTFEGSGRFYRLKKTFDGDILEVSFYQTSGELKKQKLELKNIKAKLWSLGLIPLKVLKGDATYHYANGIPSQNSPSILSSDSNGKLHQAKRIYMADSSTWRALPAKPPTLTIMANARRVGKLVLRNFK